MIIQICYPIEILVCTFANVKQQIKEMCHFIANNALMFEKINAIQLKQLEYQKDTDEKFGRIFDTMYKKSSKKATNG